uniref:Uncharacterized protein n=1 Tax=Anguilla anguilla TaxID=7936 RepID=A0A0E9VU12_ANGAN
MSVLFSPLHCPAPPLH